MSVWYFKLVRKSCVSHVLKSSRLNRKKTFRFSFFLPRHQIPFDEHVREWLWRKRKNVNRKKKFWCNKLKFLIIEVERRYLVSNYDKFSQVKATSRHNLPLIAYQQLFQESLVLSSFAESSGWFEIDLWSSISLR